MHRSTAWSSTDTVAGFDWPRFVAVAAALLMFCGSVLVVLAQIEVHDGTVGERRTCGSAFDSAVDRSGWELWWARDLDEPDDVIRSSLVRTTLCPAAVNRRLAVSAGLAGSGVIFTILARRRHGPEVRRRLQAETLGGQLARLGRTTALMGGALSIAGVIAVVVLVADADSTLFLYTDRLVVGVVGLIVLMPTLALFVIGRVLALVGPHLDQDHDGQIDA